MVNVSTSLDERAQGIFADLGYEVADDDRGLLATREWKRVRVTTEARSVDESVDAPLRCFVTWETGVDDLLHAVRRADPAYDWAIIGVDPDGSYEVARAP